MDRETGKLNPEELPDGLEKAIGEVQETEKQCPGVFYVCTNGDGRQSGTEFYLVERNTGIISAEAKTYGVEVLECPQYLIYLMDRERQIRRIIDYEVQMYRLRTCSPLADKNALRETALYGAEDCPEYFGAYPAPIETPYGHTMRYKTLMNGAFWVETDECKRTLTVSWPLWLDSFSRYTMRLAKYESNSKGKDDVGYLFFPEEAISLALFELRRTYPAIRSCAMIDADALMNAIYKDFPDYAIKFNSMEQTGNDDPLGQMLAGSETKSVPVERMIRITPEAGTDFLRF